MARVDILYKNEHKVAEMLGNGARYREVGQAFGVSKDVVAYFCKLNNLSVGANKNSEEDAARKIREKSNGLLEYVSGYTIKEKPVRVRCLVCGGEFERTFHNITTKGGVTCPHCVKNAHDIAKAKQEADKEAKAEQRRIAKEKREVERERIRIERIHPCPVCGTETNRHKYCSNKCQNKASNKSGEIRRRNLIKLAMVDRDITVEGLYRRDNGVCYLCGNKCNLEDYTVQEGTFIAGDWYPSIDHIIPLAKGGLHSWDNVMLAHRRCNSEKSDKTISPYR